MLYSGTDPELYITEYTLIYEEKIECFGGSAPEGVPVCFLTPLSSGCGTYKTVTARFWPWLEGKSPENVSSCSLLARKRCMGWARKVDVRLPGKGNSNSHGARPVHLIITMIK